MNALYVTSLNEITTDVICSTFSVHFIRIKQIKSTTKSQIAWTESEFHKFRGNEEEICNKVCNKVSSTKYSIKKFDIANQRHHTTLINKLILKSSLHQNSVSNSSPSNTSQKANFKHWSPYVITHRRAVTSTDLLTTIP